MVTINDIKALKNTDGITLRENKPITYKVGYQVATEGVTCLTADEVMKAIANYNGDCGIWLENGVYYVDKSHHVKSKEKALEIGRKHKQISILNWSDMSLIYC